MLAERYTHSSSARLEGVGREVTRGHAWTGRDGARIRKGIPASRSLVVQLSSPWLQLRPLFGVEVRCFRYSNYKFCSSLNDTDETWMQSAMDTSLHGSGSL